MGEFERVTKRPPTIPNLIINGGTNDPNNNQLIGNLQKNNVICNNTRRCSTGLLFEAPTARYAQSCRMNNRQLSSFRQLKKLSRLQNLHYESVGLGLNSFMDNTQNQNIYNQNLKLGFMLR